MNIKDPIKNNIYSFGVSQGKDFKTQKLQKNHLNKKIQSPQKFKIPSVH